MNKNQNGLKVDVYAVLDRCIEEGYQIGYNRAHKHQDNPSPEVLQENITRAVMNSILEYFKIPE